MNASGIGAKAVFPRSGIPEKDEGAYDEDIGYDRSSSKSNIPGGNDGCVARRGSLPPDCDEGPTGRV